MRAMSWLLSVDPRREAPEWWGREASGGSVDDPGEARRGRRVTGRQKARLKDRRADRRD
jgi:hypothetical protein